MKFQHLVRVNDRQATPLTRDELWRGLMLKAENPLLFVEALDDFRLLARDAASVRRELRFGEAIIRDRVSVFSPDRMRHEIETTDGSPGAVLEIRIEDSAGGLAVRFDYETPAPPAGDSDQKLYQGFVQQAYVDADTHAIDVIRQLAKAGKL